MSYFGRLNELLKLTANTYPELYLGFFYLIAGTGLHVHKWYQVRTGNRLLPRHKYSYTVMRSDDERLQLFPKSHVTEKHLLPADHPETIADRKIYRLPPLKDPYVITKELRKE